MTCFNDASLLSCRRGLTVVCTAQYSCWTSRGSAVTEIPVKRDTPFFIKAHYPESESLSIMEPAQQTKANEQRGSGAPERANYALKPRAVGPEEGSSSAGGAESASSSRARLPLPNGVASPPGAQSSSLNTNGEAAGSLKATRLNRHTNTAN
ncbi:hypothetical protein EYF80_054023 [Liparis tanakae]|uniref:Uncharacterized protein n=1 Tax=Liparis tanakae TaxID=230148 RepID=A0A4Z2F418_9TELE|nr:hypothetical protein EYF80_054023 [Liparis tanakae]